MTSRSPVALAALDNARWCDAVAQAHGGRTHLTGAAWWNDEPSPPYYPNLVTLAPGLSQASIRSALEPVLSNGKEGSIALKDSFRDLDPAPLGFAPLFDAHWLWREPDGPASPRLPLAWRRVATPEALREWEHGWWRAAAPDGGVAAPPLFPARLLQREAVTFLLAHDDAGRAVLGCALSDSDDVVGISCIFDHSSRPLEAMADLVAQASAWRPGKPLVGYASGGELELALACGFTAIGALRVWLRAPSNSVNGP
ncbi:MAG TPA: hypothetical protein VJ743_07505 [Albitalea sp.]|nr:hypothetical protein [Albitalea sp.]